MNPLFSLLVITAITGIAQNPQTQQQGLIRTKVAYASGMMICVGNEGVAAARFDEPFELGNETGNGVVGIKYRWRFQAFDDAKATNISEGDERLFVNLRDGDPIDGQSILHCGPIAVQWIYQDNEFGILEFDPKIHEVYIISENYFEHKMRGEEDFYLKLISFQPTVITTTQMAKNPSQPDKLNNTIGGRRIAAHTLYEGQSTLIQDDAGIASINFGKSFNRLSAENTSERGVTYDYTFWPISGDPVTGSGEVYELYKGNAYQDGESKLEINAGQISITWSIGGEQGGWLYYEPTKTRVWRCETNSKDVLQEILKDHQS